MSAENAALSEVVSMLRQITSPWVAMDAMARADERALIFVGKRHRRPRRERPAHLSAVTK